MNYTCYDPSNVPDRQQYEAISRFLFEHLDVYGDPIADIRKCMDYALGEGNTPGGFILTAEDGGLITSAVVVNETGMGGYIPENILVYIATHKHHRGKGIGKQLMKHAIDRAKGDIALHVEPENPARRLYESLGFTNKYLEMRLKKGGS